MAFCRLSQENVANTTTSVDNIFINNYLPFASGECVKVYLYGLYKCSDAASKDNTIENFARELNMSEEDVTSCFYYWQDQGLVQVIEVIPLEVRYLPITNVLNGTKKYNVKKYGTFNAQAQEIISGRMITPKEYEEYYNLIENFHMEKEALLMVMKYCVETKKDENIGYNYITTVAKDWAFRGITTSKQIEEQIAEFESLSDGIMQIVKAMKSSRTPSVAERLTYKTWLEMGYEDATLIKIAKNMKRPSFELIDKLIKKYYSMKLFSIDEIEGYEAEKKECFAIAKKVTSSLGLYYENLEPVVDTYIYKWLKMGFSVDMLYKVASYSFKSNIRTLDGLDEILLKFQKMGIQNEQSLSEYFANILSIDEKIKEILTKLGLSRKVNQYDRDKYNLWKNIWNFSDELIEYAISLSQGKEMQYLGAILSSYHMKNITSVADAKNSVPVQTSGGKHFNNEREYTQEQTNALFDNVSEVEV